MLSDFALLALLSCATTPSAPPGQPGLFVLGVDGMDPEILRRLIAEGRMPNFAKLANDGAFQELGTSTPPQSPVAWSNFVTGLDPGGHGIYDFVHRDPQTYLPISSATPPPGDPGKAWDLFGYYIPISGGDAPVNNRTGTPWWDALHGAGIPTEVYRVPGNYPPTPSEASVLSGMGTIDMRGGYGVYTWFTDQPVKTREAPKGDIQKVSVQDFDLDGTPDTVTATLKGPPDLFHLPPGETPKETDYLTVPVTITLDPEEDVALIRAGDSEVVLKEGEWSPWIKVSFDALPEGMMPLDGAVRFFAKELRPGFAVYASPVNISAENPPQEISTPSEFATDLYEQVGQFYTQGMPEEVNALKDGTFDDDDYVRQVALIQNDAEAMLNLALSRYQTGDATFFYLSDVDLQCHMLWRHGDPKNPTAPPHPAYEPISAAKHSGDIENYYIHVDQLLGRIRSELPPESLLMVMSDHGFQPYRREVNLNSWLRDNGWLTLKDGKHTGHIATGDIDWSKTKAYGIGFNALYLNIQGRESQGIIPPNEAAAEAAKLATQLKELIDPQNGAHVVLEVSSAADVFHGARVSEAPDLIVGYDKGYGCSDQSTLGEITDTILEDNVSRWSGNHLMAASVVPGVVLANRPLAAGQHHLIDVTSTLLAWYGVPALSGMTGHSILAQPTP